MFRSLYAHAGLHYALDRPRIRAGQSDVGTVSGDAVYQPCAVYGGCLYQRLRFVQRYLGSGGRGVDEYRDVGVVGLVFRPARNSCGRIAEPADRGILLEALFPVPEGSQRETADICEHVCETWIARIGGVGRHVFDSWTFAVRSDCGNRFLADLRNRRNRNILFVAFCGPLYCD